MGEPTHIVINGKDAFRNWMYVELFLKLRGRTPHMETDNESLEYLAREYAEKFESGKPDCWHDLRQHGVADIFTCYINSKRIINGTI